jgi:hypothetical protein
VLAGFGANIFASGVEVVDDIVKFRSLEIEF